MKDVLRKAVFAFPFGCLTALVTHEVRFGDDHAFGGEANTGIVSAAIGGSLLIAMLIFYTFLTAGSTTVTGTLARVRVRALLPGQLAIFGIAAAFYYGIELLEGNGLELGWPTLLLAVVAAIVALLLRALCAELARFVDAIVREFSALLRARPRAFARALQQRQIPRAQTLVAARRFGRAPPNERQFS